MRHVETAIVGAGFAGLGMALALQRAGRTSFVVLERAASVGGTWRENTYPGIACDVPSHLYGFASHPHPGWSGLYARGDEIRAYLEDVAVRERIPVRLNTTMTDATWNGRAWVIQAGDDTLTADTIVLACGRLTEPAVPEIAGLESFPGPIFHSARWDHSLPLDGSRIAVAGTGASAVQLVPELVRRGAEVVLFQRTPAWIVPRGAHPYTDAERERFAAEPALLDRLRADLYTEGEERFASRSGDARAAAAAQAVAEEHLARQIADPHLRAALTPDYAFGCKRVLLSDDFYPAVASAEVAFEASALVRAHGDHLVAASGARYRADALVLATGFASTQQPFAELVHGEEGVSLANHWSAGMTSFASTVVSGFPNLFVLDGPNASLGHNSSVLMIEAQAEYVVRCLARRGPDQALRLRPEAEQQYTAEIEMAARSTPWLAGGCHNWYVDDRSGRLTLLWPATVDAFRNRLARADGSEFESVRVPLMRGTQR